MRLFLQFCISFFQCGHDFFQCGKPAQDRLDALRFALTPRFGIGVKQKRIALLVPGQGFRPMAALGVCDNVAFCFSHVFPKCLAAAFRRMDAPLSFLLFKPFFYGKTYLIHKAPTFLFRYFFQPIFISRIKADFNHLGLIYFFHLVYRTEDVFKF